MLSATLIRYPVIMAVVCEYFICPTVGPLDVDPYLYYYTIGIEYFFFLISDLISGATSKHVPEILLSQFVGCLILCKYLSTYFFLTSSIPLQIIHVLFSKRVRHMPTPLVHQIQLLLCIFV